ncbi:3-hydroxybutyrate dehydrogenase [Corynebacterium hindlerae]|uniref:3-oxoacyl-[acyl-carrier-protein] reductase MabA n=1 Tax=Corynebacterium hindlerae TaxID=699041 RepID=A0A7G5FGQ7_9CORY|nr:3-hydroxybutyrate dehydrogenase [Corynebacterium hindlerae]QMV85798.1 3-hydroxybutyrate dehydrogenase [Corynebacterium hindlerae]
MQLAGKTALVTGGASGIGAAISRRFAAVGANVIVADLDSRATQDIAAEISGEPWVIDLADTDALDNISLDVDILVNCAGIQRVHPIQDFPVDEWRLIQRLMLESPFLLIKAALPKMYERGYGRILNISSVHGLIASPFKSAYVAAKHGLEGLSKVVALEGAEHGVTSNCINPGYVRTPLVEKQIADQAKVHGIPEERVVSDIMLKEAAIKRLVDPAEVADMALWLVSDNAQMVTGSSFTMDGGWTAN